MIFSSFLRHFERLIGSIMANWDENSIDAKGVAGRDTGDDGYKQTAQFFFQAQGPRDIQQKGPHSITLRNNSGKSAPMISKKFLQLLDKNSNPQPSKESMYPLMNRSHAVQELIPVKITGQQLRPNIKDRWRGMSANEVEHCPTDISFDGKPSTGTVFKRKFKQGEENRKTKRMFVTDRKTMTPEAGAFTSSHARSTHFGRSVFTRCDDHG